MMVPVVLVRISVDPVPVGDHGAEDGFRKVRKERQRRQGAHDGTSHRAAGPSSPTTPAPGSDRVPPKERIELIRTSYTVPPITQFRLRLELASRRTRRALEQRRRDLREGTTGALRAATAAPLAARDSYLRLRWAEDLKRERAAYDEFFDQYDEMVGLLCLAAHQGIEPGFEDEYQRRRVYFTSRYPHVKGYLAPHLENDPSDVQAGRWGRRSCDAFEAMFAPHSIAAMLETDGGNLIGRMCRTQVALAAWEQSIARREAAAR